MKQKPPLEIHLNFRTIPLSISSRLLLWDANISLGRQAEVFNESGTRDPKSNIIN